MTVERWALLLATLLHDVPWKPWIVTGSLGGWEGLEGRVRRECRDYAERLIDAEERNDREAQALIAWIACRLRGLRTPEAVEAAKKLVEVAAREWRNAIREADVIASSIDRLLAPRARPQETRGSRIVNMFNPALARGHRVADHADRVPGVVERFLGELDKLVGLVASSCQGQGAECILQRLYLALYSLLDVIWYRASREETGEQLTPVADTRVPHHTVFDHLRAAATALALKDRSVYAIVDIPGVHAFISAARKTRDYWSGSWLISALAWEAVKIIVREEGPQAVLVPSLQLNPFYLDMLSSEVSGVEELYPKLAWDALGRWPSQPVMPATVSLVLDGERWSCERLREAVERGLRGAWERLWGEMRRELEELKGMLEKGVELGEACRVDADALKSSPRSPGEALRRLLCLYAFQAATVARGESMRLDEGAARQLLERLVDYLLAAMREPPVEPRVTCIEVDYRGDDYHGFVESVAEKLTKMRYGGECLTRIMEAVVSERLRRGRLGAEELLDRMLRLVYLRVRLDEEAGRAPNAAPSYTLRLYGEVARLWEAARGAPRRNAAYRYCSMCGRLPAAARLPRLRERLALPGGRILVVHGELGEENLVAEEDGVIYAGLYRLQAYTGFLADEGESLCPYCLLRRLLARYTSSIVSQLYPSAGGKGVGGLHSTLYVANAWNEEEIVDALAGYLGVGRREAEELFNSFGDLALDMLRRRGEAPSHYRRVAVVYGDGDMGGGYLRGVLIALDEKWPEAAKKLRSIHSKVCRIASGLSAVDCDTCLEDIIPALVYNVLLQARAHGRILDERVAAAVAGVTAALASVLRERGLLGRDEWPPTVVPTLSYLRSFSTALMISSLVDAVIVRALRGILVYAGGDDVLAVMPVAAPPKRIGDVVRALGDALGEAGARVNVGDLLRRFHIYPECRGERDKQRLGACIALTALLLTRLNYWGLLGEEPGFHVYGDIVAQAVAAHGRSYGVNIVHFRTPLWEALNKAHELMEVKDRVRLRGVERGLRKDYAIIGFEGGEEAVTPLYCGDLHSRLAGRMLDAEWPIAYAALVYGRLACGVYATSLVYDVLEPSTATLASKLVNHPDVLAKLLRRIVARNRVGPLDSVDEELAERLSEPVVELGGEERVKVEPFATHVFRAVRHLTAGARR